MFVNFSKMGIAALQFQSLIASFSVISSYSIIFEQRTGFQIFDPYDVALLQLCFDMVYIYI